MTCVFMTLREHSTDPCVHLKLREHLDYMRMHFHALREHSDDPCVHVELRENSLTCFSSADKTQILDTLHRSRFARQL